MNLLQKLFSPKGNKRIDISRHTKGIRPSEVEKILIQIEQNLNDFYTLALKKASQEKRRLKTFQKKDAAAYVKIFQLLRRRDPFLLPSTFLEMKMRWAIFIYTPFPESLSRENTPFTNLIVDIFENLKNPDKERLFTLGKDISIALSYLDDIFVQSSF